MPAEKPYIVIAEDDPSYGRVYVNKLSAAGFDVKLISRGDQIIDALKERRPALLLLDLIMPGLDGFAVLEQIRNDADLKDLRVIVASNLSQDIDRDKVARYKVYGYFVKSNIPINEVIMQVRAALEGV